MARVIEDRDLYQKARTVQRGIALAQGALRSAAGEAYSCCEDGAAAELRRIAGSLQAEHDFWEEQATVNAMGER